MSDTTIKALLEAKQRLESDAPRSIASDLICSKNFEKRIEDAITKLGAEVLPNSVYISTIFGVRIHTLIGMPETKALLFSSSNDCNFFLRTVEQHRVFFGLSDEEAVNQVVELYKKIGLFNESNFPHP